MNITREQIINVLRDGLKNNSFVFAFWLEGADAHDKVDEYSDIDMWFDVQDQNEGMIIKEIESILSKIAPLDFVHEVENHPHPKIRQIFLHLAGTPKYLIIDVCVQSHSRDFYYTHEHTDEKVKIIFDNANVITYRNLDKIEFQKVIKKRVQTLKKTFSFFQAWIEKEINRNNFLEALGYYHSFILNPLVEVLRIKHEPTKSEFGLKHISRDLPPDALAKVEDLYKVNTCEEIATKKQKANELFFDVLTEIEKENIA